MRRIKVKERKNSQAAKRGSKVESSQIPLSPLLKSKPLWTASGLLVKTLVRTQSTAPACDSTFWLKCTWGRQQQTAPVAGVLQPAWEISIEILGPWLRLPDCGTQSGEWHSGWQTSSHLSLSVSLRLIGMKSISSAFTHSLSLVIINPSVCWIQAPSQISKANERNEGLKLRSQTLRFGRKPSYPF